MEKIVNSLRKTREDEKRKLRPEIGNDSPAQQQTVPNSNASTVIAFSTPTMIQPESKDFELSFFSKYSFIYFSFFGNHKTRRNNDY